MLTDWAPLMVAIVAVAVSVISLWLTREHNRKQVEPHIKALLSVIDQSSEYPKKTGLFLESSGLGPAVLLDATIESDGTLYNLASLDLGGVVRSNLRHEELRVSVGHFGTEVYLLPGERHPIFQVTKNPLADRPVGHMGDLLKLERLVLRFSYTSVYRKKKTTVTFPLDHSFRVPDRVETRIFGEWKREP